MAQLEQQLEAAVGQRLRVSEWNSATGCGHEKAWPHENASPAGSGQEGLLL